MLGLRSGARAVRFVARVWRWWTFGAGALGVASSVLAATPLGAPLAGASLAAAAAALLAVVVRVVLAVAASGDTRAQG